MVRVKFLVRTFYACVGRKVEGYSVQHYVGEKWKCCFPTQNFEVSKSSYCLTGLASRMSAGRLSFCSKPICVRKCVLGRGSSLSFHSAYSRRSWKVERFGREMKLPWLINFRQEILRSPYTETNLMATYTKLSSAYFSCKFCLWTPFYTKTLALCCPAVVVAVR